MDSGTQKRLVWSFLSSWVSRLSSSLIQLLQVYVFLRYWDKDLYGAWLIVTGIPTQLSFSTAGFGSVAGNEMTMLTARNERDQALRVFESCWWFICITCVAIVALLSGALYFLPASRLLQITQISDTDTKWIIFYLGVSVLLGQLEQLLQSAYRSVGRYAYGSFIKSLLALAAFACTLVSVALGHGPRITALVYALANIAGTVILAILVKRDIPWIEYGWRHASLAEIRKLVRPAFAFMGFPIGNALNISGAQYAVNYALGPGAVVIFNTTRQVSRFALQMVQLVNSTFEPEMTIAFGAHRFDLLRTLHRRACQLALIVALVLTSGLLLMMFVAGDWLFAHWSHGQVQPDHGLLSVLLLVVVIYALWSTSSTLMTATNQHQRLAAVYVTATGITCALCFLAARWYGLFGAAAALLLSEAIMNLYVLPSSLRIAHDTFPGFLASMFTYPAALRPQALRARLRRAKSEPEELPPPDDVFQSEV